jgi:predicted Zn-dependent peptidase
VLSIIDKVTLDDVKNIAKHVFDYGRITLSVVSANPPEDALEYVK